MNTKRGALLLVLLFCLGTALAMAVSGQEADEPGVVAAVEKNSIKNQSDLNHSEIRQADIHYDLSAIKRAMPENIQQGGLFGSRTWYAPLPLVPVSSMAPPPPPPPSAPPLAFTFLGRMIDRGEVTVFLSKGGRQYTVKVNDILDDTYRVDKITVTNAVLTYIPLNIQQSLAFNSTAIGSSALNEVMATPPQLSAQQASQPY